ncbi:MaoC/PaaZ C-terminal domain-containing protein [Vibrio sp. WXL210]|uniref:MaoC/PaaZ C-terminal domain-containing protein n=1 Tax=Vibrio sp. WXL210 TaxID=3450709 RepID=UPI003EC65DEE
MTTLASMPRYHRELLKTLFVGRKPRATASGSCDNDSSSPCQLTVLSAQIDPKQLRDYNRYFMFEQHSVALPFWFVFSQPVQLALFNLESFPVSVLGLVHTGLTIEKHQTRGAEDQYTVVAEVTRVERQESGTQVDVAISIFAGDELCVSMLSNYLSPSRKRNKFHPKVSPNEQGYDMSEAHLVDYNIGKARKYAKLSGDYNPIHIHTILAKLFGFKRPILHGMYSVASLFAYCNKRNLGSDKQMRVRFKRPLLLPQQAYIVQMDTRGYLLNQDGKCCVEMVW